jgi:hypothetical protein
MRDEFIHVPKNASELVPITKGYEEFGLPGCCGSMDVVHVRWLQCPTGDLNRAKGKGVISHPCLRMRDQFQLAATGCLWSTFWIVEQQGDCQVQSHSVRGNIGLAKSGFLEVLFCERVCLFIVRYVSHLRQWIFALANVYLSLYASASREFRRILLIKFREGEKGC